ncbi:MAG: ATP-binding protein [Rhodopila sp.]
MQRREEMQAMLLQTRKLEALGQLTGGVAHDFNNVLTAITGTYGLIRRRTDSPVVHDLVSRGERAVERAANLTRQLLTFARKQDLCPAALDLSTMLRDAEDMVRHAIISSIRYTREIPPDIWPVLADRQQLEVALLNLAVNARDAMLDGGTLTITARNLNAAARPAHLPARDYVAIAVRDTGTGMPPEIISRVIEPFFTTKEQGKGTGLGLAMVNGFAEQSGGCLRIESAPGSGTTIEIILPRADRPVAENDGRGESVLDSMLHGDATILVVDDDEPVRTTIAGLLRDLGYTVIEARNAEVAQVLVHTLARLDLVITDVMMPGATGPVLAAKLRAEHPALPILFVTGHSFNESLAGEAVLAKPFTEQDLAAAVLERLGRRPAANASPLPGGAFVSRLRTQPLREAYLAWMRMQMGGRLPRPDDVDPAQFGLGPDACWVAVDAMSPAPAFRFLEVGQALQARLGRPLEGETAGGGQPGDEELGALIAAYRRCASQKVPVYQSAHYDFSDGEPVRFDRLVLPFSADTLNVTHLLALVQFEGRVS